MAAKIVREFDHLICRQAIAILAPYVPPEAAQGEVVVDWNLVPAERLTQAEWAWDQLLAWAPRLVRPRVIRRERLDARPAPTRLSDSEFRAHVARVSAGWIALFAYLGQEVAARALAEADRLHIREALDTSRGAPGVDVQLKALKKDLPAARARALEVRNIRREELIDQKVAQMEARANLREATARMDTIRGRARA